MVICKFFLQGACRFGTKCNNEHLDIKQLVKSDLEAAINGKQWPLSCFGPFKDKPSVPNFIEDQSFEEIRWMCYEAKQKNCVDQYVHHFNSQALDANNKMKTFSQLPPQVVEIICNLYDTPADAAGNANLLKNNTSNPFGFGNNTNTTTNNDASLFGKPVAANTANIFGSIPTAAAAGGALFGGGNTAFNENTQQNSLFAQQQNAQKTASLFASGNTQPGLFGQTQTNSVFGQTPQATGGLFGGQQQLQQQPQQAFGDNLFAQAQAQQNRSITSGGLFSQAQQGAVQGGIFGQSAQQQNPLNTGNIFAQTAQQQVQAQNQKAVNAFQANTPQQQQQTSVFGQQNPGGMFGQMASTATPTSANSNIFGQTLGQTNAGGLFNNNAPNTTSASTQNIFAQALQQQQQQQQQQPSNIFAQTPQQLSTAQAGAAMQPPSGFFQQTGQPQNAAQPPNTFGQAKPLLQSPVVSSTIYSKLEELSAEDIEAFKADTFAPGKIPSNPPPIELLD